MAGGRGTNSNFTVFWVLRCQNRRGKSLVYLNDDQQRQFAPFSLVCFTLAVLIIIIIIYLLYAHTVYAENTKVKL